MVSRSLSLFVWLILVAAPRYAALAQVSSVYGSLRVSVADITGAQVPNCLVTVKLPERNWSRSALTTSSGVSYFPALTPGDYVVSVALNGFEPQEVAVRIMLGHEAVLQFSLRPAAPSEEVTVTAASSEGGVSVGGHCERFALVDVDAAEKKTISREDIDAPPHQPGLLPPWLAERGATMIIAGGMGQRALGLFAEQGIQVVLGAAAETPERLVSDYLAGTLQPGENACDH